MKRSRLLLLVILIFFLGFGAAYILFTSDILQVNRPDIGFLFKQKVAAVKTTADNFITYIDYDGTDFSPRKVIIKKGNYIAITNKSKTELMWLVSNNTGLNTKRGYAEGERLQLILLKEGRYVVANRLNTKASTEVVVEP